MSHLIGLENFRQGLFSKTVAITTLSFFAWTFCLSQPAYAVQQDLTKEQRAEAAYDALMEKTPDDKFTYRLQKLKDKVQRNIAPAVADREQHAGLFERGLQTVGLGSNTLSAEEQSELEQLQASIEAAWQGIDSDLADVEKHLRDKRVDKDILQRQQDAKNKINGDYKKLIGLLNTVNKKSGQGQAAALAELNTFLSTQQFEKSRPKFDPNHLPFGTPKPVTRAPLENGVALYQLTHPSVQLASNTITPDMLAGVFGQQGGVAADLAETMDTTQTQAIKDLAVQLHNNPTEIYTWVANNIRFVPSYGSIQGADMTLQTKRGNAMDTASLLIAILRAAGTPARYAYGTVQMPIDKAMNWVGGVTVPEAAANLMQQGGIPTALVTTNGVVSHIKFEHTWVEAWVDYEPSRGLKNIEGDNWVPMDASYKQYDYENIRQESNPDIKTTVSSVLTLPVRPLAAGLPYQLIVKKQNVSVLPDDWRWKYKMVMQSGGGEAVNWITPLSAIAGKTLGLAFTVSDSASQQVLDSYKNSTQGLPGYLINLKAEWVKNSEVVQSGGSFKMGEEVRIIQQLYRPGVGWDQASDSVAAAGEYHGITIDTGNDTADSMNTYYDPVTKLKTSVDNYVANGVDDGYINKYTFGSAWYSSIIKDYFVGNAIYDQQQAIGMGVVSYRLPSYGIFKTTLDTKYYFGIPRNVEFSGFTTDIDVLQFQSVAKDNNQDTAKQFMLSMGFRYSFLEGEIPEQILSGMDENAQGVSAVELLGMAKDQGQTIIEMTQADMSALSNIIAPAEVIDGMRNALYAGKVVTTHINPVVINGKALSGYMIIDPVTGAGAYKISSGQDGGFIQAAAEKNVFVVWTVFPSTNVAIFLANNPELALSLVSNYFHLLEVLVSAYLYVETDGTVFNRPACLRQLAKGNDNFPDIHFVTHYFCGDGEAITLDQWGLGSAFNNAKSVKEKVAEALAGDTSTTFTDVTLEYGLFSVGRSTFFRSGSCSGSICSYHFYIRDKFQDPLDIGDALRIISGKTINVNIELPHGSPYDINHDFYITVSQ